MPLMCPLPGKDRCSTCAGEICSCFHSAFLLFFQLTLSAFFFLSSFFCLSNSSFAFFYLSAFSLSWIIYLDTQNHKFIQCEAVHTHTLASLSFVNPLFEWCPVNSLHFYTEVWEKLHPNASVCIACRFVNVCGAYRCVDCCEAITH